MLSSRPSLGEEGRRTAPRSRNVSDALPQHNFEAITRLVADICETPVALISVVDGSHQWCTSTASFEVPQTFRTTSFASHAIENPGTVLIVPNALEDPRFANDPFVTGEPRIRFYAAVPLVSSNDAVLGSLCIIDRVPRLVTVSQISALRCGGDAAVALFEHQRSISLLEDFHARAAHELFDYNALSLPARSRESVVALETADVAIQAIRHLPAYKVIDALPGTFYIVDANFQFLLWNSSLEEMSGYSAHEIAGMHPLRLFVESDSAYVMERIATTFTQGFATAEADILTKDGRRIPYFFTGRLLNFEGRRCIAGMGIDISERRRVEELLKHSALHDALTGLPNRLLLADRLLQIVIATRRTNRHAVVMYIDIDRLKNINDTLDHRAGDDLIRAVGGRLLAAVRSSDTVARLSGGQFVIVFDVDGREDVAAVVANVARTFHNPFVVSGQELHVTSSIGISVSPDDGNEAETLIRNADTAMYEAKARGRNRNQYYKSEMHAAAAHRLSTENDLSRALQHSEFVLHYQPTIELSTGRIVSAEALIRWNHPTRGLLAPAEFIDIAEETNLIVPIGAWVLKEGVRQAKRLAEIGIPPSHISVNVSGRQLLDPAFLDHVRAALLDSRLPVDAVGIEITETAALGDPDAAQTILAACKNLGLLVLLDDFGTRYSSLTYLKKFPIDVIKIDKSFVDGLPNDVDDGRIIDAIIGLGESLDCDILAEGVETEPQARWLAEHKCRFATGYLYARPMPALQFEQLLLRQRSGDELKTNRR